MYTVKTKRNGVERDQWDRQQLIHAVVSASEIIQSRRGDRLEISIIQWGSHPGGDQEVAFYDSEKHDSLEWRK